MTDIDPTEFIQIYEPDPEADEQIYRLMDTGCGCCSDEVEYSATKFVVVLDTMIEYLKKIRENATERL